MDDLINALAKGVLAAVILFPISLIINRWNKRQKQKEEEKLERLIKEQSNKH